MRCYTLAASHTADLNDSALVPGIRIDDTGVIVGSPATSVPVTPALAKLAGTTIEAVSFGMSEGQYLLSAERDQDRKAKRKHALVLVQLPSKYSGRRQQIAELTTQIGHPTACIFVGTPMSHSEKRWGINREVLSEQCPQCGAPLYEGQHRNLSPLVVGVERDGVLPLAVSTNGTHDTVLVVLRPGATMSFEVSDPTYGPGTLTYDGSELHVTRTAVAATAAA